MSQFVQFIRSSTLWHFVSFKICQFHLMCHGSSRVQWLKWPQRDAATHYISSREAALADRKITTHVQIVPLKVLVCQLLDSTVNISLDSPMFKSNLFQSLLLRTRMEEVVVELSSTKTQLTIGFVKSVENAKEVRKLLMSGGLPDTLLVKSSLIPSPLVVAVAANKADLARKRGNMKTRSVQTETLYNLSSSKNITESLKNFGGGDSDQSFVVAGFGVGLEAARGVIRYHY